MLHILVTALTDVLVSLPSEPPYPAIAPPPDVRQAVPKQAAPTQATAAGASHAPDAGRSKHQGTNRRTPSVTELQAESRHLLQQQAALLNEPKHTAIRQARQKLPAFSKRTDLLAQLSQHSVVVISGATGTTCCESLRMTSAIA